MFKRLKYLYEQSKVNNPGLETAVSKGWITAEQKNEIVNS